MSASPKTYRRVAFERIAQAAIAASESLARAFLPDGKRDGAEWIACNPCRADQRPGSFKINLLTGKWADFASGDKGGDLISLAAFVEGISQREAALRLADILGVDPWEGDR